MPGPQAGGGTHKEKGGIIGYKLKRQEARIGRWTVAPWAESTRERDCRERAVHMNGWLFCFSHVVYCFALFCFVCFLWIRSTFRAGTRRARKTVRLFLPLFHQSCGSFCAGPNSSLKQAKYCCPSLVPQLLLQDLTQKRLCSGKMEANSEEEETQLY